MSARDDYRPGDLIKGHAVQYDELWTEIDNGREAILKVEALESVLWRLKRSMHNTLGVVREAGVPKCSVLDIAAEDLAAAEAMLR